MSPAPDPTQSPTLQTYLPAAVASTLPPPNFINPHTDVTSLIVTEVLLTTLMFAFVGARFYARIRVRRAFGADDAVMGLAALTSVVHTVVTCVGTRFGVGWHLWDVRPERIPVGFKWVFTSILLFIPTAALTKISVCFGYLRLFPGTSNLWFCYVMVAYSVMWGLASFFAVLFQCVPVSLFWNRPYDNDRNCVDVLMLLEATAALNSLGDLLVYLWPIKFLFKLQMPLKHRMGLIALFSVGCCVFAASVCRMIWMPPAFESYDTLYNSAKLLLIACVEENIGIICGCLPSVKAFLSHFFPTLFGSTSPRSSAIQTKGPGAGTYAKAFSSSQHQQRGLYHHSRGISVTHGYGCGGDGHRKIIMGDDFEMEAGDDVSDLDERRLVEHPGGEPVSPPPPGIVKTQSFSVRRTPSEVYGPGGSERSPVSSRGNLSRGNVSIGETVEEESVSVGSGSSRSGRRR